MGAMDRLKIFVVQEPVVAASCLIAGFGLFLPAVVRPILDSFETSKQVPPPALSDVAGSWCNREKAASYCDIFGENVSAKAGKKTEAAVFSSRYNRRIPI